MMRLAAVLVALVGVINAQAQLVTTVATPEQFVDFLLGDGIVATNITYIGGSEQVGTFNGENCNIGLPSGAMLASGDITGALGPNNSGSFSLGGGHFGVSDPDIDALDPFSTHNDAAVLEFDFVATGDSVKFRYVFASEEYPEFVNGVNDIFGFFLSGPGINGPFTNDAINIAVVPGTGEVVSINTVNNGNDGINGPCVNCEYYIHNGTGVDAPFNGSNTYVQYDGITVVLTAEAQVQCGQQYHIKIAIADALDTAWDSGVFLEEGSFSSNALNIVGGVNNPPAFLPGNTVLEGCVDGFFTIVQPDPLTADTLALTITGSALPGVDIEPLPFEVIIPVGEVSINVPMIPLADNLVEGTESITIQYEYINSCGDADTATATMFIADYLPMELELDEVFICPGTIATVSAVPDNGAPNYTYNWSTGGTQSEFLFAGGGAGEYSVTVTDFCDETITANFTVIEPTPFVPVDDQELCLGVSSVPLATGGATPYTYSFDPLDVTVNESGVVFPLSSGEFTVTVTDQCDQSADIDLFVIECNTVLPNVFSPNEDGKNDTFEIFGIEGFPSSTLLVYSRWGALIYENSNYNNTWRADGVAEGVYFIVFKRSDGENFEGYVHILR